MPAIFNRKVTVQAKKPRVLPNSTSDLQETRQLGNGQTGSSVSSLAKQSVVPKKKAPRARRRKKREINNISVQQEHPQLRQIEEMEEERRTSPDPCPCCAALESHKPWQTGPAPFVISRETKLHENCRCAGCKEKFTDKPPPYDLIISREEFDYISGTKSGQVTTVARKRRYCLSVACVKKRHPNFNPMSTPTLDLSVTFTADEQRHIVQFRAGV